LQGPAQAATVFAAQPRFGNAVQQALVENQATSQIPDQRLDAGPGRPPRRGA
jgi:hypothetical protein